MPVILRNRTDLNNLVSSWKTQRARIAFVPTMGALHEGHLSLVRLGLQSAERCVVSIFVNPAQFAPHEDFAAYPRQEDNDIALLGQAGADAIYIPETKEIYPQGALADLKAGAAAKDLESDFRPHFFDGVVSVVARLFEHVKPDIAIFGEKDYQQLCVIREMMRNQDCGIEIIGGPIIRDQEGLALSSRNAYFSGAQLKEAQQLNKILSESVFTIKNKFSDRAEIIGSAIEKIIQAGFEEVQYLELRDAETLQPTIDLKNPARLLVAAKLHGVRLIDNMPL